MSRTKEIVWTPELGSGGRLMGITLSLGFVKKCEQIPSTPELIDDCRKRVWDIVKPEKRESKHTPSNILFFDNKTMLTTMLQHYQDAGKWLEVILFSQSVREENQYIEYSFHHASDSIDDSYNRWLMFCFSRYVKYMQSMFARLKD